MADAESALIQELRALAGASAKEDDFILAHGEARIRVVYVGGSSSSVTLRAPYDQHARAHPQGYRSGDPLAAIRPMKIELRPEVASDRDGKASGMDVEVQTGDAPFDDKVYIDTLTPRDVVANVLTESVRGAVLELFAIEFTSITIDDGSGQVSAMIASFASLAPMPTPGKQAIDAFARLVLGLPRVRVTSGEHPKHPLSRARFWLGVASVIALPGSLMTCFGANPRCDEEAGAVFAGCLGPGIVGVVVGLLGAGIVAHFAVRLSKRYRGRSDSSSVGFGFASAAFALAFFTIAALVAVAVAHRP